MTATAKKRKDSRNQNQKPVRDLKPQKDPKGGIWDKEHVLSRGKNHHRHP